MVNVMKNAICEDDRLHDEMEFICDVCNESFRKANSLLDHMGSDHRLHQYSCTFCDFKSRNKDDMILHRKSRTAHKSVEKICKSCGMRFARFVKLVIHVRATQKFGLMDCSICDAKPMLKCAIKVHEKEQHSSEKSKYKCNKCHRVFKNRKQAFEHKRKNKCGQRKFVTCIQCDFVGTSRTSLLLHKRKKHRKNKVFECDSCGHTFLQKPKLMIHLKSQIKYGNVICLLCDFKAPFKCVLKIHYKKEHVNTEIRCKVCTFKATTRYNLMQHNRQNHKPQLSLNPEKISSFKTTTYKCKNCDHRASNKEDVMEHNIQNHPISIFKCTICEYSTPFSLKLVEHRESRHDEFACDLCYFKADRQIDIMIHKEYNHKQNIKN